MSQKTKIEWATHTWNPVRGCSRISPGCLNCYAERIAGRFSGPLKPNPFEGFAVMKNHTANWTGKVELIEDKLMEPLRWRKPRRVFVNSMSDLFHEALPDEAIDRVFAVMALCPQQTFMVLTKRAERMAKWITRSYLPGAINDWLMMMTSKTTRGMFGSCFHGVEVPLVKSDPVTVGRWPLTNVWLGVSTENQKYADERIPWLLKTPAAVRFVSYEPALGPIKLHGANSQHCPVHDFDSGFCVGNCPDRRYLNWVIAGGESGPEARPAHPDWFRSVRDQCAAAGVAFFFKQWGEWAPGAEHGLLDHPRAKVHVWPNGDGTGVLMRRVPKKHSGRLLDGREHNEFPQLHHNP